MHKMPSRVSPLAALAIAAIAGVSVWITWRAKALEKDLDTNSAAVALVGKPAPAFRLPSLDGRTVSLSDYLGKKKLVLIFWASWNNSSHSEVLALNMFYKNSHKPASDFEVAGVSVDDSRAAAQKFVDDSRTPYPVLLASRREAAGTFGIRSIPTVMLIDTSGKVEYGLGGYNGRVVFELASRLGIKDYRLDFGASGARGN